MARAATIVQNLEAAEQGLKQTNKQISLVSKKAPPIKDSSSVRRQCYCCGGHNHTEACFTYACSSAKLSTNSLEVLGKIKGFLTYGKQSKCLPLYVVSNDSPSLFGGEWLQYIKLNWKQIAVISNTTT